ncbi:MAG TPA: group II intron reverse transcriptase/maturase, partial [Ruminococcaceae bacterium]|nr:group II intron reverse transcriptase/maturase [Oscillospiraceae bacterium]
RNLYNPEFYLLAYQNIAVSQGSMTAGTDKLTLDGMSMERIEKLIAKIKDHSYRPNPARRVYIAKKNSNKKRPLGIPSTDDKLIQEVVRMILEAIYEPT